jgi:hypothetical protein
MGSRPVGSSASFPHASTFLASGKVDWIQLAQKSRVAASCDTAMDCLVP